MNESQYIRKQASKTKRLKVVKPEALDDERFRENYSGMVKYCGCPMGKPCEHS